MAPPTFNMLEARLSEGLFGLPHYPLIGRIKGMGVHALGVALPLGARMGKKNGIFAKNSDMSQLSSISL